jgi:hypothetical protein
MTIARRRKEAGPTWLLKTTISGSAANLPLAAELA